MTLGSNFRASGYRVWGRALSSSSSGSNPGESLGQAWLGSRRGIKETRTLAGNHIMKEIASDGIAAMNLPLKWHGGKYYLASKIVRLMPPHLHYVEPFFGGGAVLFSRDPDESDRWLFPHEGVSEVVNDINGLLINFYRVLQDRVSFEAFRRTVEAIPMAREEWEKAHAHTYGNDPVADAIAFFVDCRLSRSGMMNGFTSLTRNRTRRRMNGNVSEWLSAIEGLPGIHRRLRRVFIEKMPAIELINREDTPGTLFYCDPPYLHETRTATDAYAHEMTASEHQELLETLLECKGKVMLSGYPSAAYDSALASWNRHTFELPNNAAGGETKRRMTEVLWCNF
jgi:DNA adenine methylase